MRPRLRSLALLVATAVALAGCGSTLRPPAATVNGSQITQEDFEAELEAIRTNTAYLDALEGQGGTVRGSGAGTLANSFVGNVLTVNIILRLVVEELRRRGLEVTAADLDGARPQAVRDVGGEEVFARFPAGYRDILLRRGAALAKFRGALSPDQVDATAVADYYAENTAEFATTCVSHVLFAVETGGQLDQQATEAASDQLRAEAAATKAEVDQGADFAGLAASRSKDPGSAQRGGSLGCGPAGRFVASFDDAIGPLAPGEVSGPVQTQFGWHLIRVDSRQVPPLEEVSDEIRQRLESGDQGGLGDFLQGAIGKADVSVNPRYGTFQKEGQSLGVVPPVAPTTTVPGGPPVQPGGIQTQP